MMQAAAIALFLAAGGTLPEWQRPQTMDAVNKTFVVMASSCAASFGFTALQVPPQAVLRDKLDAYLMLSGEGELKERQWLSLVDAHVALLSKDGLPSTRASEALGAAVDDPDSYRQAEELYVRTVQDGEKQALELCRQFADDPYIGAHFLTGKGVLQTTVDQLKQDFAKAVAELRVYKAKVMPPERHRKN